MMVRKMTKREAGRMGGVARQKKYGDLGTPIGRAKGGRNSLRTHKKLRTAFKQLRRLVFPRHSIQLAEFLGIIMGDGHVGQYQTTVTTNSITDRKHAEHVCVLIRSLLKIPCAIKGKKQSNALSITISSKEVCSFLQRNGIPQGNKIQRGIKIPSWVLRNKRYMFAVARGLFDTDGCVFWDKHRYKGKLYRSVGMAFANKEPNLLEFFVQTLSLLGLKPTQTSPFRVFLRRKRDINRYFEVVGTSNPKHESRYRRYRA